MKKVIFFMMMVLTCQLAGAQQVGDLYGKYKAARGSESVSISPFTIRLASLFADNDEDRHVLNAISSVRILSLESCSEGVKANFHNDITTLQFSGYESLVDIDGSEGNMRIMMRMKDNIARELLILCGDPADCALIQIKGKMTMEDIAKITKDQGGRGLHISLN